MKQYQLSKIGLLGRTLLRRFIYSQLSVWNGIKIALGLEQPLIRFKIENDPPSVYWLFEIKEEKIRALEEELQLPDNFSLIQITCLDGEEAKYMLALNAYRVSGLAKGIRAEWSVFVNDGSGKPKFMIVDARSSQRSVDPINIITRPSLVMHKKKGNWISTRIGEQKESFTSKLNVENSELIAKVSNEWIGANDRIYWLNGIRDRTFYDANLAFGKQVRIVPSKTELSDKSHWAQYLEPNPLHVLVIKNSIEFIISPWENVEKM
jgi:hypothetical protein